MSFLKKINRGAIVSVIILLSVIVYLVALAVSKSLEMPAIRKVCADYISTEVSYSMLPEAYRTAAPDMPAVEKEQYLADMKQDISSFLVSDGKTGQLILDRLQASLEQQMSGDSVIYEYQKTIIKFESAVFSEELVTVTLQSETVYDGPFPGNDGSTAATRQRQVQNLTDTVILKKIGGEWKVFFASLLTPNSANGQYASEKQIY
jgi:hypothetical protein